MDSHAEFKYIAVLMACYNRKSITMRCLDSLFSQKKGNDLTLHVYLVDDGSSDGTGDAVRNQFSDVHVIQGDGNLYWCGGMRRAWREAEKGDYEAYLWLNDDTLLLPGAIKKLLDSSLKVSKQEGLDGIIIGSCYDPDTRQHAYGGRLMSNNLLQFPYVPMVPSDSIKRCDTMNGNLVLIPRTVFNLLGNLSPEYTHAFGDGDYGMRAVKAGITLWVAPGYLAECTANTRTSLWTRSSVPLLERWRDMCSPLGLPPKQWLIYVRRNTGLLWILNFIKPFVRLLFPWAWKS